MEVWGALGVFVVWRDLSIVLIFSLVVMKMYAQGARRVGILVLWVIVSVI